MTDPTPGPATLVDRPMAELVDDLLTAVGGGVTGETFVYDVGQAVYPLAERASVLRTVTGFRSLPGTPVPVDYAFRIGVDVELDLGRNAVAWLDGGILPADGTTVTVGYLRAGVTSPLTDLNVGSVTRTLVEAVGHEIAVVYQQINEAYRSGFLDTATGRSLDLVVSILGLARRRADSASGLVTFYRATGAVAADGAITIPAGLALRTTVGTVTFEVTGTRMLQRGQARVDVPVRAATGFEGPSGAVPANQITTPVTPLAGIDHVTNLEPTVLGAAEETDDELRLRARAALTSLGAGTLAAIVSAAAAENATVVEVWDPEVVARPAPPGTLTVLVEAEPERFPGVQAAVQDTRAAGVAVTVVARYVFVAPRLTVTMTPGLTAPAEAGVIVAVVQAIAAVSDPLGPGDPLNGQALLAAAKGVSGVVSVTMADVLAWRADVARPGTESLVDAVLAAVESAAGDPDLLRAAVTQVIAGDDPAPPTAARIPDRSLILGLGGQRATDAEIAAGTFRVVTPADGTWWVTVDIGPDDVAVS
jgi:uncharacterized phage protein gp47/JayE